MIVLYFQEATDMLRSLAYNISLHEMFFIVRQSIIGELEKFICAVFIGNTVANSLEFQDSFIF
jgi:hypothetical protein